VRTGALHFGRLVSAFGRHRVSCSPAFVGRRVCRSLVKVRLTPGEPGRPRAPGWDRPGPLRSARGRASCSNRLQGADFSPLFRSAKSLLLDAIAGSTVKPAALAALHALVERAGPR
jgi:hypothetical protein